MSDQFFAALVSGLVPVVQAAGRAILTIRSGGFEVDHKTDSSPVTQADREAEAIIMSALGRLAPDIPVIGEEAVAEGHIPETGDRFFLVDALDGTKEFVAGRDEFTVNIALIEDRRPVFGLVYAPVLKKLYFTPRPGKAASMDLDPDNELDCGNEFAIEEIRARAGEGPGIRVVASRSHLNEATQKYLEDIEVSEYLSAGSSLKFCLLAEGKADLYPRLAPTMEWDTAAGQAVLEAAGGTVTRPDGSPFLYGKKECNFLNGDFIARAA